jgi:hypothetical protein
MANFHYREIAFRSADKATRASGRIVKQALVFDMLDLELAGMMDRRLSSVHTEVSAKSALYYPQLLSKICMVNSPSWMSVLMVFLKSILPKKNTDKIEIFTSVDTLWESQWTQQTFNRDHFPPFLSGFREEVHPTLTGEMRVEADTDWKEVTIGRGSKEAVTVDAPVAGLELSWELVVVSRDVMLSATFSSGEEDSQVVLEPFKVEQGGGLHSGKIVTPGAGTVTVVFDNYHSYVRSKTVKYRLKLEADPTVAAAAAAEDGGKAEAAPVVGAVEAVAAPVVEKNESKEEVVVALAEDLVKLEVA